MIRIFHAADLHYCPKHLRWVDRAFSHGVDEAIKSGCEIAVIAGDSFDATMGIHEPAVTAYMRQIARLADNMPVIVLQGTFSHDRPGSLDMLREIRGGYPVRVVDEPERFCLYRTMSGGLTFDDETPEGQNMIMLAVNALPSLNKGDPTIMDLGAKDWAGRIFENFSRHNVSQRQYGIPSILVTHGTVIGSTTESGYAMVSPDHEFSLEMLAAAEADAVLLGHIHKHQNWFEQTPSGSQTLIAYPGSIAKLVYGQFDHTGFLIWDLCPGDKVSFHFEPVPSRDLVEISFDGAPDIDELRRIADQLGQDDHVRIRWNIDQEHASTIDKRRIRELFANAGGVKLEGVVNPVQSVRAAGIGRVTSLADKIDYWADTTGDAVAVPGLLDRLEQLRCENPERIVMRLIDDKQPMENAA